MQFAMYTQVKRDNLWHGVDAIFKSALKEAGDTLTNRPYDGRNYVLFEILTGKHFKQNDGLTELPPICGDIAKNLVEHGSYPNDYVFQYATLKDLLEYDWGKFVARVGYITERQYRKLKDEGTFPAYIRNNVLFNDVNVVKTSEMDLILKNPELRNDKNYFIKFEYEEKRLSEECNFFFEETIPALIKLIPNGGNSEDVRIIYGMI